MIEYHILKALGKNPAHTQRSLARTLNVSVGKVNYVLSGLIDQGIIRARKLRNHPERIRWQYVLTPKGIKEKMRITRQYLRRRLKEYRELRKEIDTLQKEVEDER